MEIKLYYSEEFNRDMLELSDRHVMWDIAHKLPEDREVDDTMYSAAVFQHLDNLGSHYHTEFYQCGRSGRHVCVEDTPTNRRNYRHMVNAVEKAINSLINEEMEFYTEEAYTEKI